MNQHFSLSEKEHELTYRHIRLDRLFTVIHRLMGYHSATAQWVRTVFFSDFNFEAIILNFVALYSHIFSSTLIDSEQISSGKFRFFDKHKLV